MQKKLDDQQRDRIAELYSHAGYTMEELAAKYNVHRRTIQRVLLQKGIISPRGMLSERDRTILDAVDNWRRDHIAQPYSSIVRLERALSRIYHIEPEKAVA